MMSMLTFVVIMLALGTLLQRVDIFEKLLGMGKPAFVLARDDVTVSAKKPATIDVLANDKGLAPGAAKKLIVVTQPECGRAEVRDGKIRFQAADRCMGPQRFNYAVSGQGDGITGEVVVTVKAEEPSQHKLSADAQRDVQTPVPQQTARNDAPQSVTDPSVLAAQSEGGTAMMTAPSVPRPQTGQAGGLSPAPARSGGDGFALSTDGGQGPSFVQPSDQPAGTDTLAAPPRPAPPAPQQLTAVREPAPGEQVASAEPQGLAPAPGERIGSGLGSGPATGGGGHAGFVTAPAPAPAPAPATPPDQAANGVSRRAPAELNQSRASGPSDTGPLAALQPILGGGTSGLVPVDTTPPPDLKTPGAARPSASGQGGQSAPAGATRACDTPATLTLDIRPSAATRVSVHSPCDTYRVAAVSYDGLDFAFKLDAVGRGSVTVPGLQPSSQAKLTLPSGRGFAFDLPFKGTRNMDRVAVVWTAPVTLGLHAFEFGAKSESAGHVSPARPRDFAEVRRSGGGYLTTWQSVDGQGDNVAVYTYWRRPGGPTGVVNLKLEYTSRDRGDAPATCGTGAEASPRFDVIRSMRGRILPAERRQIAPVACTAVASAERLIGDAVDDIVIRRR